MGIPVVHLVGILFLFISEFFILQTGASFYIELVERPGGPKAGKLRLYECPSAAWTESLTTSSERSASRTNQDILCTEVTHKNTRALIYAKANFFAVTPRLNAGQRIMVGGSALSSSAQNLFLGVSIIGRQPEWPSFLPDAKQALTFQARYISKFFTDVNMGTVVTFMIQGNYRVFAQPTKETIAAFKQYVTVMENVQTTFSNDAYNRIRYAQPYGSKAGPPQSTEKMDVTLYAINFLLQKMIDPCFSVPFMTATDAHSLCSSQCQFLSVGFGAFSDNNLSTAECSRAIAFGSCSGKVCMCAVRVVRYGCQCGVSYSAMIKCSNVLRTGITGSNF